APLTLGNPSPRAVDLTAEPLVFQLERLRLALQPFVRLPQLGRFALQAIVLVERTVDRCHPALHRFDPPARLAHGLRPCGHRIGGRFFGPRAAPPRPFHPPPPPLPRGDDGGGGCPHLLAHLVAGGPARAPPPR